MIKASNIRRGLVYTIIMGIVLIDVILGVISYTYRHSEREAFERLRLETQKYKSNINLQVVSDKETLRSMASLIGDNYNDESGYIHVCEHFEAFGLCENIGILVPGDRLITKRGPVDVSGKLSFEEEKLKGEYVSGKAQDVTNEDRFVVRNVVPVNDHYGVTKAILYGSINVDRLSEYYDNQVSVNDAYLCLLEGKSGEYIIDTKNPGFISNNIANLASVKYKKGYSYSKMAEDINNGTAGYTAFVSKGSESEYLYVRYDSLGVDDWCIMLAQPESVVFAGTNATLGFLVLSSFIICLIVFIYIMGIMFSERRRSRINSKASDIRKSLLEINQRSESVTDALCILTRFAKSRSAFITDSYGDEHHYILPSKADEILSPEEIKYFNDKLLSNASRHRNTHGANIYSSVIETNKEMLREMPEFYYFMQEHKIRRVIYAVIIGTNSNIYVLGTINPLNSDTDKLIIKIAACFSMALYNRKYLERTTHMALTDSLTGVENRMAFGIYINSEKFTGRKYSCIYADVNELHYYNNKYGHAAGDQMLKFIAERLRAEFDGSKIYRMGGDEFLILCNNYSPEEINEKLEAADAEIKEMKYHVAFGVKYGVVTDSIEELVNEAEKNMYIHKADYYHDKGLSKAREISDKNSVMIETGVKAIDACLAVMTLRYLGIYYLSVNTDRCIRIIAPTYLGDINDEVPLFSESIKKYVYNFVKPEFHRTILSFLDYNVLKNQLKDENIQRASYERIDGEQILLKIYPIVSENGDIDCIWVFEKENI